LEKDKIQKVEVFENNEWKLVAPGAVEVGMLIREYEDDGTLMYFKIGKKKLYVARVTAPPRTNKNGRFVYSLHYRSQFDPTHPDFIICPTCFRVGEDERIFRGRLTGDYVLPGEEVYTQEEFNKFFNIKTEGLKIPVHKF